MTLKHLAILLLAAGSLTGCIAGKFMSNVALKPANHGVADIERTRHKADSLLPGSTKWYDDLKAAGTLKDLYVESKLNGNKIHACYVPAKDPATSNGTAVVVHGYGDNHYVYGILIEVIILIIQLLNHKQQTKKVNQQ